MARTKQTARKSTGGKAPRQSPVYRQMVTQMTSSGMSASNAHIAAAQRVGAVVQYDLTVESAFFAHYFRAAGPTSRVLGPAEEAAAVGRRRKTRSGEKAGQHNGTFAVRFAAVISDCTAWIPSADDSKTQEKCNVPKDMAQPEALLGVFLSSPWDGAGLQRPPINLVCALDISGSMTLRFQGDLRKSKMEVAKFCLQTLLEQLKPTDSFGLVIFNHTASVVQPLAPCALLDKRAVKARLQGLRAGGGTDISSGIVTASSMITAFREQHGRGGAAETSSDRIFFLTDMEVGSSDAEQFLTVVRSNAQQGVFASVTGIGLDLDSSVIKEVSQARGCNYQNVRDEGTFKELVEQEFSYSVSPCAFDVSIELQDTQSPTAISFASGFGTPELHQLPAQCTKVKLSTVFPSVQNAAGENRAGLLLVPLRTHDTRKSRGTSMRSKGSMPHNLLGVAPMRPVDLKVTYTDLNGLQHTEMHQVNLQHIGQPTADQALVKGVLLRNYVRIYGGYITLRTAEDTPSNYQRFLALRSLYGAFAAHFYASARRLGDASLSQEYDNLLEEARRDDIPLSSPASLGLPASAPATGGSGSGSAAAASSRPTRSRAAKKRKAAASTAAHGVASSTLATRSRRRAVSSVSTSKSRESCCVCLAAPRSVVLLPCKHMCLCAGCAGNLSSCPLCTLQIVEKMPVFV